MLDLAMGSIINHPLAQAVKPYLQSTANGILTAGGLVHGQLQHIAIAQGNLGKIYTIVYNASNIVIPTVTLFYDGFRLPKEYGLPALSTLSLAYTALNALKDLHPAITSVANKVLSFQQANLPSLPGIWKIVLDASDAFLWFDIVHQSTGLNKLLPQEVSIAFAALTTLYAAVDTYRAQAAQAHPQNQALIEQIWEVVKKTAQLMIPLLVLQDSFIPFDLPKQIIAFVGVITIALYAIGEHVDLAQVRPAALAAPANADADTDQPNRARLAQILLSEIQTKGVFKGLGDLFSYGAGSVFQGIESLRRNDSAVQKGFNVSYRAARIIIATGSVFMSLVLMLTDRKQTALLAITIPALLYALGEANPQARPIGNPPADPPANPPASSRVGKKKTE